MKIRLECSICKIYIDLPLEQFSKSKEGGFFLNGLKCINCQSIYKTIDLDFNNG